MTVEPADAIQDVTWETSNFNIAKVNNTGAVVGKLVGYTVDIKAWTNDGTNLYDTVTVHVVKKAGASAAGSSAEADIQVLEAMAAENAAAVVETPETALETEPEKTVMAEAETGPETGSPAISDENQTADEGSDPNNAEVVGPHFAVSEQYLHIGESLILDIVNPDDDVILVGLGGETDAVLWNEELRMVTSIGEAEVTAFLATSDPVEIRDMMTIHVVTELPGEAAGLAEAAAAAEGEESEETVPAGEPGEAKPEEPVTEGQAETEEMTEPAEGETITEGEPAEAIEAGPEPEAGSAEAAEEVPAAETVSEAPEIPAGQETVDEMPEIIITDLRETDELGGTEAGVVDIPRERFEMDDELLESLVFKVKDETIAEMADRTPEEIIRDGISLKLLAPGETMLMISREGDEEPLREIRVVVVAAPAAEEAGLETVIVNDDVLEEEPLQDSFPDENDARVADESGAEEALDTIPAEEPLPAAEGLSADPAPEQTTDGTVPDTADAGGMIKR